MQNMHETTMMLAKIGAKNRTYYGCFRFAHFITENDQCFFARISSCLVDQEGAVTNCWTPCCVLALCHEPESTAFTRDARAESGFDPLVPVPDKVVVK